MNHKNQDLVLPKSTSLRARIAYAIAQADGDLPGMEPDTWDYKLADAVIRELQLTEDGGVIVGCIHD